MKEQIQQAQFEKNVSRSNNAKRKIWVTFQREGIHRYPAALEDPELEEVSYLGHNHRHVFHFNIAIEIFHLDRELEFIKFKHFCENLFDKEVLQLDGMSCEMISDRLYFEIVEKYPDRDITISVSEDNENGSTIEYNK